MVLFRTRGVSVGDPKPIIDDRYVSETLVDRLLIDAARQGRGYGRAAVASLLARLAEEYGPRDIYLSVVDGNTAAARLYEAFGFVFTEERDVHGEHVMRRPAAPVRGS